MTYKMLMATPRCLYDEKSTGGKEPSQVKNEGRLGKIKLSKLRPVHKKRKFKKLFNQLKRIGEDNHHSLL